MTMPRIPGPRSQTGRHAPVPGRARFPEVRECTAPRRAAVSGVSNRDHIAWVANKPMKLTVACGASGLSAAVDGQRGKEQMKNPASLFSSVIFWLIAALQVLRIVFQVHVTAGGVEVPIWASIIPVVFFAALGAWLWAERRG